MEGDRQEVIGRRPELSKSFKDIHQIMFSSLKTKRSKIKMIPKITKLTEWLKMGPGFKNYHKNLYVILYL